MSIANIHAALRGGVTIVGSCVADLGSLGIKLDVDLRKLVSARNFITDALREGNGSKVTSATR